MKRTVLVLICALSASCALFASFDGHSSLSGVYTYNDGTHYLGIGSDSFGFVNDFPLGYYAGIDASFSTQDVSDWRIGLIAGPAYSYDFGDSGVSCDVAAGISMDGTLDAFSFGLGGYIGASWKLNGVFGFGIGASLGSNFVEVALDDGSFSLDGDFFVTPSLSAIFYY